LCLIGGFRCERTDDAHVRSAEENVHGDAVLDGARGDSRWGRVR
jgi:hypothetical protein